MANLIPAQPYDALGERTPAPSPLLATPTARRARAAAIAVFWSLALVIVAGRIHYAPSLLPGSIELASR